MPNRIGIMQGRLSAPVPGKIQAFPLLGWRNEFKLAAEIGFELIEWVLDLTELEHNPILSKVGRDQIINHQKEYNIEVPFICCDYFMEYSLIASELSARLQAQGMLLELIRRCPEARITNLEIPLLGKSEVKSNESQAIITGLIEDLIPILEKEGVRLLLELNLPPAEICKLYDTLDSRYVLVNYDTGNSLYWGFDASEEISSYGHLIGNVHIKDCTVPDYSVALGKGDVDFEQSFSQLKKVRYQGDFVLQTARAKSVLLDDSVAAAREYYLFTKTYRDKYFT